MRKTVAIASLAFGLALASVPAFAGEDSDHTGAHFANACADMLAQWDLEASSRAGHPRYNEAVALRNQGANECANVDADIGSEKLRFALQAIGLNPNY